MSDGSLGKIRVISRLVETGHDVFMEIDGKSPFDLVAHKNGKLYRVEVKSTSRRTKFDTGWEVQLKRVRSNRTSNKIINFSKDQCDILAVYIEPIDLVLLIDSCEITAKTAMAVLDKDLEGSAYGRKQT